MTPGQPGMGKQGLAYRNRTRGARVGKLGCPSSNQGVQMPYGASGQASPMAPLTSPSRLQMQAEVTMAHLTLPEGNCRKSSLHGQARLPHRLAQGPQARETLPGTPAPWTQASIWQDHTLGLHGRELGNSRGHSRGSGPCHSWFISPGNVAPAAMSMCY